MDTTYALAGKENAESMTLMITGMTCEHCVRSIKRALLECRGVETAEVDLKTGRAIVTGQSVSKEELRNAITELGYDVSAEKD